MAAKTHRHDALSTQDKWNAIYEQHSAEWLPAAVLANHVALLPENGLALDLACGLGANALLLAEHGLEVEAWDISDRAIARLQTQAGQRNLSIQTTVCDIATDLLQANRYDVIVVSRFLERSLCRALMSALKPGGLLFYQTYTATKPHDTGPGNPLYLLKSGELLGLFADLMPVFYQDFARIGDLTRLERNEARFIGQKIVKGLNDD
jgi:SAM-dependent methyltransferase